MSGSVGYSAQLWDGHPKTFQTSGTFIRRGRYIVFIAILPGTVLDGLTIENLPELRNQLVPYQEAKLDNRDVTLSIARDGLGIHANCKVVR